MWGSFFRWDNINTYVMYVVLYRYFDILVTSKEESNLRPADIEQWLEGEIYERHLAG